MEDKKDEVLLRVEHLCQYFRMGKSELKAVDDVSFDIKKGEVFGLVGESGCGKTTTGRSIIKLYNITSGNIYFKGIRIGAGIRSYQDAIAKKKAEYKEKAASVDAGQAAKLKKELDDFILEQKAAIKAAKRDQKNCDRMYAEKRVAEVKEKYEPMIEKASPGQREKLQKEYQDELRKAKRTKLVTQIQMIFQDPIASLDPRLTVREIISEGLIIKGERDKEAIDKKVYEMLELVGLVREHASRYPHEFSGGQRQRIGVARSIIMNPEMIIADEPVSALDVSVQAQVINLLNELREKFGLTIMFVAHDLSVVKYFSDRIGVMYFGKLVELAPSDELFKNPLHPYTKSLLSAIPLPDPIYEKQRVRIVYNPLAEHDYSVDKPTLREIKPGHFIQCNNAEFEKYKKELK
ncbi:MAG: ATP-binding cassette domain-containing protein [Lachnospiraceae bacterium]|jgi:oligopeptide transport system ATP-binding protein|nr:ATP-binding cassette domain-containing protein [Lachnospiraceae bacterium]